MTAPRMHVGPMITGAPGNDDQVLADLIAHGATGDRLQGMIDALGSLQISISIHEGIHSPADLEGKYVPLAEVYSALAQGMAAYARFRDLLYEREKAGGQS